MSQATALYWFSACASLAFSAFAALNCDGQALVFAVVFFYCALAALAFDE